MIIKQSRPPYWSPGIKDTIKGLVTLISIVVPIVSGTSFPDGELDIVYRLQKFKQNGRRLYCSYQLDSNF